MKKEVFKKIIKEAVREVFQEEIKEILYESMKSSKPTLNESKNPSYSDINSIPTNFNESGIRNKYADILGETALSFTTKDVSPLQVSPGMNTMGEGTSLPQGEVGMDLIQNLMNGGR